MDVARGRACEHGSADRALGLGDHAGLFALVSQQVAEGREFSPVAAVVPALGSRARTDHPDLVLVVLRVY